MGRETLDVEKLRRADWLLTTYETLRDYHFSFGRVRFRVGVFDEAQKIKNVASLVTNAAICQQPDFTVLMTGTPIENAVMDLWTLLDVAWPGFLGMCGKEFSKAYGNDANPEAVSLLKAKLVEFSMVGERECPPIMLRRFKADILEGLPRKTERVWQEVMPPEQVRAYDAAVAQKMKDMPALQALSYLRQVTFHPALRMPTSSSDCDKLIECSARFRILFRILDDARAKGERVLVFVDLRQGQRVLGEIIRRRYRLGGPPDVINGDTPTNKLDDIKKTFQEGHGFAVLLLGPRSAGFGLTLTAANHVVHMNRWWNPAVEDQCSDRVYRIGQERDVFIHIPIAVHPGHGDNSFDVVLNDMLGDKRKLSREIVVPTLLTEQDFQRMFSAVAEVDDEADILHRVDAMGWKQFQDWTAEQFMKAGFQEHSTPDSGDGGGDKIFRPPLGSQARPVICQCKHRGPDYWADEDAVTDLLRARKAYSHVDWLVNPVLVAVTNRGLTLAARNLAKEHSVRTVGRDELPKLASVAQSILSSPPTGRKFDTLGSHRGPAPDLAAKATLAASLLRRPPGFRAHR